MTKVIYTYFKSDERTFFIDYLYNKHGWEPLLFTETKMRPWVNKNYPKAIVKNSMELRKGHFDYTDIGPKVPIDKGIINSLSNFSINYLEWLEDTTGWNFSIYERRQYYYDILKFWNTVIVNLKPELLVSYTPPHVPSDYPLYLLCKYYYSIPVLYLDSLPHFEGNNRIITPSMEDLSSIFKDKYLGKEKLDLSPTVKNYLEYLRSETPEIPKHVSNYFHYLDQIKKKKWKRRWIFLKTILKGYALKEMRIAFKKNKKPLESSKSQLNHLENFLFRNKLARQTRFLRKLYDRYTSNPNPAGKYIYFAAPYQPEILSNLLAGIYDDPFLILDIISAAIPQDWLIYYKEHPNTFKEGDKGALYRSEQYYKKLNSYQKVKIISPETNTFNLLDNSQAVCTVGGTVAWEAIVRGKPALSFGRIWYQSCKSIFVIETYNDAVKAIKKIVEGFRPEKEDVDRFAQSIYEVCEHDMIFKDDYDDNIKQCDDPKYEMEKFAEAFHKAYVKYYEEGSL